MPYFAAMIAALVEYHIEQRFWPSLKRPWAPTGGMAMVVAGEAVRKIAMVTRSKPSTLAILAVLGQGYRDTCIVQVTAGSNFTHSVQTLKRESHKLVTTGIYR